jgi:HD superfamily phosphohydrolase
MASSRPDKLVVDSVHGDIQLRPDEWEVVDTASFQRLRHLKQLQLAHLTYPNATHTRFAHSIGVLGIMARIAQIAQRQGLFDADQLRDIRLAGLLHDVGHYPYSHLMESIDQVKLTEEVIRRRGQLSLPRARGTWRGDRE